MSERKNSSYIKLPVYLSIAVIFGVLLGALFFKGSSEDKAGQGYEKYLQVLHHIENNYVDTVNIDNLVNHSITQMVEELDPHTTYIPKRNVPIAQSQLEGDFEGIGIEFNIIRDTLIVVAPISGGPSEEAGILAGDKIISADDSVIAGKSLTNLDIFNLLRGPKGSKVNLGVKRPGQEEILTFDIVRDKIPTYSVDVAYMVDEELGYIKVSRFSQNTYREFKDALSKLKEKGMQQLILDLKDNPGGYMDRAINMADEFLSGNKIIVETRGKDIRYNQKSLARFKGDFEQGPLIVLMNEGSASASEILAGALQDNDRALVVGRRSFGKGLVQLPFTLQDSSELRLTISRYYTPSGRSIQKPYDEGISYNEDLLNRYNHGEFFHRDSILLNDSLRYLTLHGREVYGGGGIMPDIFVPRDTSAFTPYMVELINNNLLREYSLSYYSTHKDELSDITFKEFKDSFEVTSEMLRDFVNTATSKGVKYRAKDFYKSKEFIETNIKAHIAKSLWGNPGYYPIVNQMDEVYVRALDLIAEAKKLDKLD